MAAGVEEEKEGEVVAVAVVMDVLVEEDVVEGAIFITHIN